MNAKRVLGFIVSCVLTSAYADLTDGLVAFYLFSGNAYDVSGNFNNGAVYGASLTADRFGRANNAYEFDGINDYIQIPNAGANELAREFTITFWMNPRAGYGTPRYGDCHIISKWGNGIGGAASYNFGVTSEGHLYVATFNNSVTTQVRDTSVVSTNTWHSVVLVRDATSYRLYRDGTLLFSTNSLVQPQHNSGLNLNLGREGSSNDGFYGGALDDVRIYNRALSDSEIFELYTWELGTRVEILKAVRPSFSNLSIGTKYQLQTSSNLTAWTNEGSPFTATASSMVYPGYWDVVNWNTLNFRLHVVP